jgi:hypothetical protein
MDILSRLGSRAIGKAAAAVRPIIAPLFLAAPPLMSAPAEADGDLVEPHDADRHVPAPHLVAAPSIDERESLVEMPALSDRAPSPHTAESRQGRRLPHDVEEPARVQGPMERRVEPARLDPLAPEPNRIDPPRATAADLAVRSVSDRRIPQLRPAQTLSVTDAAAVPPDQARLAPGAAPGAPRVRVEIPRRDAATLLERLRSLRVSAPAQINRRDPVVRVTIGRIEVRATPPAAPEPVAPPAPPQPPAYVQPERLTLAEYLERKREAR